MEEPQHRHSHPTGKTWIFKLRQILNVLFMVTGIAAAVMYSGWVGNERTVMMGAVLGVIAISIKMAECVLRIGLKNK